MRIRHISTRFALLLGVAAVVPLLAYGVVSILSLQRGTRESVVTGNQNVAIRAAEEIRRYVVTNAELLKALAADLQDTGLDQRQQDQILKNYILQFREFREITLFDEHGAMIASSRVGKPRVVIPKDAQLTINGVVDVADPRRRGSAADVGLRHPPDPPEPAGRLARRRVQPRGNVADGRSDPHRRSRLRAGRRPRRRARSRTATPTRRRSSRRRAT